MKAIPLPKFVTPGNNQVAPFLRRRPLIGQVIKRQRSIGALRVRGAEPLIGRQAKVVT